MLVRVDGSAAAVAALGWAGRLAARVGAEVVVASAFEAGQSEVSPDELDKLMHEAAERLATERSEPLCSSAVAHRCVLLSGSPETLLGAAVREDVDLSFSARAVMAGLLGSTSEMSPIISRTTRADLSPSSRSRAPARLSTASSSALAI